MLAYTMLLGIVPLALLGLFIAGHVLSSPTVQRSVEIDLRDVFPGTTKTTLDKLLGEVKTETTRTGVLALIASLWLASSFWGALDTSFARIYGCKGRSWLQQKRFALLMVGVVVLFMFATVSLPTLQSLLRATASHLPLDLQHVHDIVYALSLAGTLAILFTCLSLIYLRVPNCRVPWRATWPGSLFATLLMGGVAAAFPVYLGSISTIAHYQTVIVFIVIVLGWFYVNALIILSGATLNALRLGRRE